jgi:uncharacterized protein YkwD
LERSVKRSLGTALVTSRRWRKRILLWGTAVALLGQVAYALVPQTYGIFGSRAGLVASGMQHALPIMTILQAVQRVDRSVMAGADRTAGGPGGPGGSAETAWADGPILTAQRPPGTPARQSIAAGVSQSAVYSYDDTRGLSVAGAAAPRPRTGAASRADMDAGNESAAFELALFDRTNAERAARGLPPLQLDTDALDVARQRAAQMVDLPQEQISHYAPDGELVFRRMLWAVGIRYRMAGENIAWIGADVPEAPSLAGDRLMNSPTHRDVMLNAQFDRVAIGAAVHSGERVMFVQIFRLPS